MVYPLTLYYDGDCPLCAREIAYLKRKNTRDKLVFTDISNPELSEDKLPKSKQELMAFFHAQTSDGTIVTGVDAFALAYKGVGLGFVAQIVTLPIIHSVLNFFYRIFAKYRLPMGSVLKSCGLKGNCSAS